MEKYTIREKKGIWPSGGGRGEIVIFMAKDGLASLDVRLEGETLWLTQAQLAVLYGRNQSVLARHIRNVFKEGELTPSESNMQKMHIAGSDRPVVFYNLDVILSVGYRVNSNRGTQFRIWATNVLKNHLVKGYTTNERRLKELQQSLQLVEHVLDRHDVTSDEAKALLRVVTDYSYALGVLDDYDHQRVPAAQIQPGLAQGISYADRRGLLPLVHGEKRDVISS